MILVSQDPIDAPSRLAAFEARVSGAGAVVTFSGTVRPEAKGGAVSCLHLQAYSPLTEKGIEAALSGAQSRWPLIDAEIVHRIGDMAPGETIVFVATASAHRRAAFEAADFLMDYLKTEAVFWKKETGTGGESWIEPRAEDYADKARWTVKEDANP